MSKKITKFDDSDDDSFDDLSDEISEDDESEDEKVIEENKKEDRLAILGYVSEKLPASDDTDSCVTKIGGLPVWLSNPPAEYPYKCEQCQEELLLIVQAYSPLEHQPNYHRSLYVFACKNPTCSNSSQGWLVVRGQIPFTEEELAVKEEKITTQPLLTAPSLPVIDENSDWGVEEEDWGGGTDEWATDSNKDIDLDLMLKMRDMSLQSTSTNNKQQSSSKKQESNEDKSILMYKSYYIEVEEEPEKNTNFSKEEAKLYKQYEMEQKQQGASEKWGKEKYEEGSQDKVFAKFYSRLSRSPEQILRYSFDGNPLWMSKPTLGTIPNCPHCNSERKFEMQLMPTLIVLGLELNSKQFKEKIEFGVVCIYSCAFSCTNNVYSKEFVYVQPTI